MTKQEQRKAIKKIIRSLTDDEMINMSKEASNRLALLPEFNSAKMILAYKAMRFECDPQYAVDKAIKNGASVVYPLCAEGNTLILCLPESEDAFNVGAYGIIEPDINRSKIISPEDLDFIIVPGMGFDTSLGRLGRGAGYYDRLLSKCNAFKVGFAFDCQVIDKCCCDEYDVPVDCLVTDGRVVR